MQQRKDTRINDKMEKYLFAFGVKDPQGKSMSAGSSISSLWRIYSQMLLFCSHSTQMNSIQLPNRYKKRPLNAIRANKSIWFYWWCLTSRGESTLNVRIVISQVFSLLPFHNLCMTMTMQGQYQIFFIHLGTYGRPWSPLDLVQNTFYALRTHLICSLVSIFCSNMLLLLCCF